MNNCIILTATFHQLTMAWWKILMLASIRLIQKSYCLYLTATMVHTYHETGRRNQNQEGTK
jgi:hypothetical protein